MIKVFEINKDNRFAAKSFIVVVILMFISFNQSGIIYGLNISFADLFCLICLMLLTYNEHLLLPITPSVFFVLVSIVTVFSSVFLTPQIFDCEIELYKVFKGYIKLFAMFIYFIIGYNLANLDLTNKAMKWYSFSALLIGTAGIVISYLGMNDTLRILYDEKNLTRFKGLMNDPNYFSILQVIALCYFINKRSIKLHFKLLISLLIIISVLISGSKTGFITFCCYIIFKVIEWFFETEKNRSKIILVLIMLIVLPIVSGIVMKLVEYSMIIIPASERILPVFTNFGEAISGGGSIRIKTWKTALYIFAHSPIMGIGIGTYSDVAEILSGSQLIAHNTYLQLLVEWGLPLTLLFFVFVGFVIVKVTFVQKGYIEKNYILRDSIIILLISSLAISLNNSRMFWLFLGSLVFNLRTDVRKCKLNVANNTNNNSM